MAQSTVSPRSHAFAYDEFLRGPGGLELTNVGAEHRNKTRLWIFANDAEWAQDLGALVKTQPTLYFENPGTWFTACWFQRAFMLKQRCRDERQKEEKRLQDEAAAKELDAQLLREYKDRRATKKLRKSTANGQLSTWLSEDLLLHILKLSNSLYAVLELPCVCKGLRAVLGPLEPEAPRMGLVIDYVFTLLRPSLPLITGGFNPTLKLWGLWQSVVGTGGFKEVPVGWINFKILASKTLVDLQYTSIDVVQGLVDFDALAKRSRAQKAAFVALRKSAFETLHALKRMNFTVQHKVKACRYKGWIRATSNIVADLEEVQQLHQKLRGLVGEMHTLNEDHDLLMHIPDMNYTTGAGERRLEHFLDYKDRETFVDHCY